MTMRDRAGYTLMELLVVVAIMGFLATAALPMLSASRPGLESKSAARAMAQDFSAARQEAVLTGVETRVVLNAGGHRYSTLPSGPVRLLPKDIAFRFRGDHAAGNEIDFFPDGSSSGGIVTVQSAGAKHWIVAHWPSGRISLDE
jgi:general secretion pathway protein H